MQVKSANGSCSNCGAMIHGVPLSVNGKKVCPECYVKLMRVKKEKDEDLKQAYEVICSLFSLTSCPASIVETCRYLDKQGFSALDVKETLEYFYRTKGNPIRKYDDIGWVVKKYRDEKDAYKKEVVEAKKQAFSLLAHDPVVTVEIDEPVHGEHKYDYDISKL